jgi:sigma-B regulation protein RsbU (phosphoserine phosphatase)
MSSKPRKVLLVEDDKVARKVMLRQLSGPDFEILDCESAEEALCLKETYPDIQILITDWELPGLSGIELCERFRSEKEYHYLLLLTGSAQQHNRSLALQSGADSFLTKPATTADLQAHLKIADRIIHLQTDLQEQLNELENVNRTLQREIVAREIAEQKIRESTSLLEHLIDGLPFGVLVSSADNRVLHLNNSLFRNFGLAGRSSVFVGQDKLAVIRALSPQVEDADRFVKELEYSGHQQVARKNQQFKLISGSTTAIDYLPVELSTDVLGGLWVFRDVTEEVASRALEFKVAAQVQRGLLVSSPPLDMNVEIATFNQPSLQVDGDFVDFIHGGDSLDIVVGDVMGKGIPAALLGAGIKTQLLRLHIELGPTASPARFMNRLNQDCLSQLMSLNSFLTMFYARIDFRRAKVSYTDAGHTKPIFWSHRMQRVTLLEGPNTPLGFSPNEDYVDLECNLEVGDCMIFYSDGVTEATNAAGELYGEDAFLELLTQMLTAQAPADQIIDAVRQAVELHLDGLKANDDTSLVVVRVLNLPKHSFLTRAETQGISDIYMLPTLRDFVMQTCKNTSLVASEQWFFELELATSETISNVIRHSYAGRLDGPIRVLVRVFEEEVIVRVYHSGIPIAANRREPKKLTEPKESGMGLFMISQVTSQILYGSDPGDAHWVEFVKKVATDEP